MTDHTIEVQQIIVDIDFELVSYETLANRLTVLMHDQRLGRNFNLVTVAAANFVNLSVRCYPSPTIWRFFATDDRLHLRQSLIYEWTERFSHDITSKPE